MDSIDLAVPVLLCGSLPWNHLLDYYLALIMLALIAYRSIHVEELLARLDHVGIGVGQRVACQGLKIEGTIFFTVRGEGG